MGAKENLEIVQAIYAAFARGDVPGMMEHIADAGFVGFGIVSECAAPWHMQIRQKRDVPLFFLALGSALEFVRFEPHDYAADGELVYCTVSCDVIVRKTGRTGTFNNMMHKFRFANGRAIEWRGAEDTAKVMELLLGDQR